MKSFTQFVEEKKTKLNTVVVKGYSKEVFNYAEKEFVGSYDLDVRDSETAYIFMNTSAAKNFFNGLEKKGIKAKLV